MFDDYLTDLAEFKKLLMFTPEEKESFYAKKREEMLSSRRKGNSDISIKESRIAYLNNEIKRAEEEKNALQQKQLSMEYADKFFKNYQKVTLGGVLKAAPNPEIGVKMCADLHTAVQKALKTGNVANLINDIAEIKRKHNKQSFLQRIFRKKKNKELSEALALAISFVKVQKEKFDNKPELKERFLNRSQAIEEQKTSLICQIENVSGTIDSLRKNLSFTKNELDKINTKIENSVQNSINQVRSSVQRIEIPKGNAEGIIIEDEANIKYAASFDLNFSYFLNAQQAAKFIAAAGFKITDKPEEARDTGSFYLRGSEIFTPFIAKEDMPKYKSMLAAMKEHDIENVNLNIPTQPEQILREKPSAITNVNVSEMVSIASKLGYTDNSPNVNGAERKIKQKYNNEDFLFRGTMTSDANYAGSRRLGRQGIMYATKWVEDAAGYSGSKSRYYPGESGTNDSYVDNLVTYMKNGEQTEGYIGFIHVYENHDNKYYRNFEIENKNNKNGDIDYETFLTTDNRHVATYLTISSADGRRVDTVFEIPKDDAKWQEFVKLKGIDPVHSYKGREELLDRMQQSLAEVKQNGRVSTLDFNEAKGNSLQQQNKSLQDAEIIFGFRNGKSREQMSDSRHTPVKQNSADLKRPPVFTINSGRD